MRLQAVAPELGVRVAIERDTVQVQAADSGGRNRPHLVIFVPVKQENEHLRMVAEDETVVCPSDAKSLDQVGAYCKRNEAQTDSPYLFEVPFADWPDAPKVLVLLLYVQTRGVGGIARPPRESPDETIPVGSGGDPKEKERDAVARAVKEALETDTLDELRGGLIVGVSKDLSKANTSASRAGASSVTFALASCQYPSDIFDHMPDGEGATPGPADASLLALSKQLDAPEAPTLLLLAGDQVYIDATAGLFDPKVLDDKFRIPHERRGQSRGAKAVMQRWDLRVEMMLDDHEIRDNWAPNDPDPALKSNTAVERGKAAYFRYERGLKPPFPSRVWRHFDHEDFPFFLGDTRTQRRPRTALNCHTAGIMSKRQFSELSKWMTAHHNLPKFVLTPAALLPRHRAVAQDPACALHSDDWDGYPSSRHDLLKFACDNELKGLVFLSGDDHMSYLVTAHITHLKTEKKCILHSIHSSALYAPYPFANSVPDDLMGCETFRFPDPDGPYSCVVKTDFPEEGDGFALVKAHLRSSNWHLDVRFHNSSGLKRDGEFTLDLGFSP
jgi:cholesterol oxidase